MRPPTFRRLAEEGARMVIADLDGAGARRAAQEVGGPDGPAALGIEVDVSDPAAVQRMLQTTVDRFGRVDVLVNNAALFSTLSFKPIEEIGQMMVVNGGAQFW